MLSSCGMSARSARFCRGSDRGLRQAAASHRRSAENVVPTAHSCNPSSCLKGAHGPFCTLHKSIPSRDKGSAVRKPAPYTIKGPYCAMPPGIFFTLPTPEICAANFSCKSIKARFLCNRLRSFTKGISPYLPGGQPFPFPSRLK